MWTTEKPTKAGWYWYRLHPYSPQCVLVFERTPTLHVQSITETRKMANCHGEWQPVQGPRE